MRLWEYLVLWENVSGNNPCSQILLKNLKKVL